MATHQANYARIVSLRQQDEALEAQIKKTLTLLSETRRDLLALPVTTFPPSIQNVSYAQLIAYAKHISKFTVPPHARPSPPEVEPEPPQSEANGAIGSPNTGEKVAETNKGEGIGVTLLPEQERKAFDTSELVFVPWPSEEVIRQGALAQIQGMVEQGIDPTTIKSVAEQEQAEKERLEEEERLKAEEEKKKIEHQARANAGAARPAVPAKPSVFGGLDLYEPED